MFSENEKRKLKLVCALHIENMLSICSTIQEQTIVLTPLLSALMFIHLSPPPPPPYFHFLLNFCPPATLSSFNSPTVSYKLAVIQCKKPILLSPFHSGITSPLSKVSEV